MMIVAPVDGIPRTAAASTSSALIHASASYSLPSVTGIV